MARTGTTDRDLAEIAAKRRAAGAKNPDAQLREAVSAEALMRTPWPSSHFARATSRRSARPPPASCSPPRARPRRCATGPPGSRGPTTASRCRRSGPRFDAQRERRARRREGVHDGGPREGQRRRRRRTPRDHPVEALILCEALGLDPKASRPAINPSGGRSARTPSCPRASSAWARSSASSRAAPASGRSRTRAARSRTPPRPLPAAESRLGARHRAEVGMKRQVAVLGVGQTKHGARRSEREHSRPRSRGRRSRARRRRARARGHRRGRHRQGADMLEGVAQPSSSWPAR